MAPRLSRILVTNDDGIDAPGLAVAADIAAELADEVWICAPAADCSGNSRQVSLHSPLRVIRHDERRIAVTGSPADAAIIGLRYLMADNPPDLLISGVNAGGNHAKDVGHSGTVGAAFTASMLGIKSVALSQRWSRRGSLHWDTSRRWMPQVIRGLLQSAAWPGGVVYNINAPNRQPDEVSGIEMTSLSMAMDIDIQVDRRVDNRERDYFWLRFIRTPSGQQPDSDEAALERGAISVTPISLDQTHMGLKAQSPHFG